MTHMRVKERKRYGSSDDPTRWRKPDPSANASRRITAQERTAGMAGARGLVRSSARRVSPWNADTVRLKLLGHDLRMWLGARRACPQPQTPYIFSLWIDGQLFFLPANYKRTDTCVCSFVWEMIILAIYVSIALNKNSLLTGAVYFVSIFKKILDKVLRKFPKLSHPDTCHNLICRWLMWYFELVLHSTNFVSQTKFAPVVKWI